MIFNRKKQITETQKARIATSNCRSCAWRVPVNRNSPISCIWGIMDKWDIDACNGRAECDRYISDIALEGHLKMLLGLKGDEEYPFKCKVGNNSEIHSKSIQEYDRLIDDISSQGIKEFAERLKETYESADGQYVDRVMSENIDNLVKEMCGE